MGTLHVVAARSHRAGVALIAWVACTWAVLAGAQQVELQGVLGSKAILSIDGRRHVLAPGQTAAGGVRLKRVESGWADVEIGGALQRIELGSRVTRSYAQRESSEARVYADSRGMYVAIGNINGFPMQMLLDTGATYVGLDAATARRLGVNYRLRGTPTIVRTANGHTQAYEVVLDSVSVGEIHVDNVKAFVIDGYGMDVPLLGMSFLRRLEVRSDRGMLTLRKSE